MRARCWFLAGVSLVLAAGCGSLGPTTDTGAPVVAIVSPDNGATVARQVLIEVQAIDDTGVDEVRILIDGVLLTKLFTSPYRIQWNNSALLAGSVHTIRAEADDFAKNTSATEITVTIGTAHGAP